MDEVRKLALEVARCGNITHARKDAAHPCHEIVSVQKPDPATFHVPEAWAGAIDTARVLYISSNPSIGDIAEGQDPATEELYPKESDSDEFIQDFIVNRFNPDSGYADLNGSYRQVSGQPSTKKVSFWTNMRNRSIELLGHDAHPNESYAMTEVVHCKSKKDRMGVKAARSACSDLYLDRIIALSPARVLVVVGVQAGDALKTRWDLPQQFGIMKKEASGTASIVASEADSMVLREIAGRERTVVFLPHPNSQGTRKFFSDNYPENMLNLRRAAAPVAVIGTAAVVAATVAYGEYLSHGAYVCQPNRYFRPSTTHFAFYSDRQIQPHVAEIEEIFKDVVFTSEEAASWTASQDRSGQRLGVVIASFLAAGLREHGERYDVILLSQENEASTLQLTSPVINDLKNSQGRAVAFTQGQRYVDLEVLTGGISLTSKIARLSGWNEMHPDEDA